MIENLPKGALVDKPDARDYAADPVMAASPPVDFSQAYCLPNPGDEDQGQSLSCVAQAWSYYHTQLHPKNYSRRDLYARIFQSQGGAYIRDGGWQIVKFGQATRDEVLDPQPETEANMRDKTGVTPQAEASDIEASSFLIGSNTIDALAQAVRDYKGVVFGVTGSNPGWQDMTNPRPPASGETTWGHALYAMGYHLHNGVKCIIAKSSWCSVVSEHHIKENYFESGNTFNAWTLIPKGTSSMHLAKDNGTVYLVAGVNQKVKIGIADTDSLMLFGDEPVTDEDTSAIPETKTLTSGFSIHNK